MTDIISNNVFMQRKPASYYARDIAFFVLFSWLVFQFPSNLLRLNGSQFFTDISFYVMFVMVGLSAIIFALEKGRIVAGRQFIIVYCLFIAYSFFVGIFSSNEDVFIGLRYYILPLAVIILVSKPYLIYDIIFLKSFIWRLVAICHVISLFFYFYFLKGFIYPGIGVQPIAYAFLYFLFSKNVIFSVISFACIVLEAKRSILFSVILTLVLLQLFRRSKAESFLFFAISVLLVIFSLKTIGMIEGVPIVDRLNILNPLSPRFDIIVGSSGRMGELISFFSDKDIGSLILGSGLGFSYFWDVGYASTQSGEVKGYFHSSYVNYIAASGVFGVLLSLYLFRSAVIIKANWPNGKIVRAFCLFTLIQAFFGFNLAGDVMTWVVILFPIAWRAHAQSNSFGNNFTQMRFG